MGFGIYNNVAVAAKLATKQYGVKKVFVAMVYIPSRNEVFWRSHRHTHGVDVTTLDQFLTCITTLQVLIVDWDVHHGNGTQRMFKKVSSCLTCCPHAFPARVNLTRSTVFSPPSLIFTTFSHCHHLLSTQAPTARPLSQNPNVLFFSVHRYEQGSFYPGPACFRVENGLVIWERRYLPSS